MQENLITGLFSALLLISILTLAKPAFADECPDSGFIKSDALEIIKVGVYERESDPLIKVFLGLPERVDGNSLDYLWLVIPDVGELHHFMAPLNRQVVNGQLEAWVEALHPRIGDYKVVAAYLGNKEQPCTVISELELKDHPAIQKQLRCVEEKGYLQCLFPPELQGEIEDNVLRKLIDQNH